MSDSNNLEDPRFVAVLKVMERTGLSSFELRYSDPEEEDEVDKKGAVIWMAIAYYEIEHEGQRMRATKVGAHVDPVAAMFKLADEVFDGAMCIKCQRPMGFLNDDHDPPDIMPVCWLRWDEAGLEYIRDCDRVAGMKLP